MATNSNTMRTMICGRAVVRTMEDSRYHPEGTPVPGSAYLCEVESEVRQIVRCRGGWSVDFAHNGSSGWYPHGNIELVRIDGDGV